MCATGPFQNTARASFGRQKCYAAPPSRLNRHLVSANLRRPRLLSRGTPSRLSPRCGLSLHPPSAGPMPMQIQHRMAPTASTPQFLLLPRPLLPGGRRSCGRSPCQAVPQRRVQGRLTEPPSENRLPINDAQRGSKYPVPAWATTTPPPPTTCHGIRRAKPPRSTEESSGQRGENHVSDGSLPHLRTSPSWRASYSPCISPLPPSRGPFDPHAKARRSLLLSLSSPFAPVS